MLAGRNKKFCAFLSVFSSFHFSCTISAANLDWTLMKMLCFFHRRRRKLRNIYSFSAFKARIVAFSSPTRQGHDNFVGGGFLRLWKSWNIYIYHTFLSRWTRGVLLFLLQKSELHFGNLGYSYIHYSTNSVPIFALPILHHNWEYCQVPEHFETI